MNLEIELYNTHIIHNLFSIMQSNFMQPYLKNCYTHVSMVRFLMCKTDEGLGVLTSSQQKLIITYICYTLVDIGKCIAIHVVLRDLRLFIVDNTISLLVDLYHCTIGNLITYTITRFIRINWFIHIFFSGHLIYLLCFLVPSILGLTKCATPANSLLIATIAWDAAAAIAGLPAPICPNVYDNEDGTVREFAGLVSRREGDATSPLLVEFEAMDADFCLEVLTLLNEIKILNEDDLSGYYFQWLLKKVTKCLPDCSTDFSPSLMIALKLVSNSSGFIFSAFKNKVSTFFFIQSIESEIYLDKLLSELMKSQKNCEFVSKQHCLSFPTTVVVVGIGRFSP
ncbi:hypothetical protein AGLY_011683, partial [Aphis glycines]